MLMTHDFIGRLKNALHERFIRLSGGVESEWKSCSSLLSVEKNASVIGVHDI